MILRCKDTTFFAYRQEFNNFFIKLIVFIWYIPKKDVILQR